jgi:RHS repeat-associated protein
VATSASDPHVPFTCGAAHCLYSDGVRSLAYGADNRLLVAGKGGGNVNFTCDWQHHITQTGVGGALNRRYVYDGWHLIADHRRGGDARGRQRRTLPAGRDEEARGSQWQAEIGLYNYRNRFYHAEIGRFLQPDPIGFEGGDLNIYGYVRSVPIGHNDPMGLQGPFLPIGWQDLPKDLKDDVLTPEECEQLKKDQADACEKIKEIGLMPLDAASVPAKCGMIPKGFGKLIKFFKNLFKFGS